MTHERCKHRIVAPARADGDAGAGPYRPRVRVQVSKPVHANDGLGLVAQAAKQGAAMSNVWPCECRIGRPLRWPVSRAIFNSSEFTFPAI
ncbi:hypothetical protein WS67_09690 [Burkholderia singularis]|uniref:Uncharacterized protein n=1 Tax=Burkholderia singularis TaxID=1503053 RepID=A0A103E4K0_9BURK|nr:hypothetical protein WS67_09690 [Burkholderia singularis]